MFSSLIAPLPMQRAGLYGACGQLDEALRAYCRARRDEGRALAEIKTWVRQRAAACHLAADIPEGEDFDEYVGRLYCRVVDLRYMPVRAGLSDRRLSGAALTAYIVSRVRFAGEAPSLLRILARESGVAPEELFDRCSLTDEMGKTRGEVRERLEERMVTLVDGLAAGGFSEDALQTVMAWPDVQMMSLRGQAELGAVFSYITRKLVPSLRLSAVNRAAATLTEGGALSCLPSPQGWEMGQKLGAAFIERYILDEGRYPETVTMILWEEANRRSRGQCVAEFLYLLGVRPVWNEQGEVIRLAVVPARALRRPRVDVIACVSGRFRRWMGTVTNLLGAAVEQVAALEGCDADNFPARHIEMDTVWLRMKGYDAQTVAREAKQRVFLEPPADGNMAQMPLILRRGLSRLDAVVKNEDTRATHMFCSDVYPACQGAVMAAVRDLTGHLPAGYIGDSSDPERVRVRPVAAEARRLFWGEAVNPKFLADLRAYGEEGAQEMMRYLARLCRWDACSDIMEDWMYEMAARLYCLNREAAQWLRVQSPSALYHQCQLLLEAVEAGRLQAKGRTQAALSALVASLAEAVQEEGAARA